MNRRPKGYLGLNHETIGSDVLAVLRSLQALAGEGSVRMPEKLFGAETVNRLSKIDPNGWYPIGWLLDLMEILDEKAGRLVLMKMGRTLFRLSHEAWVRENMHTAREILLGFDEVYRRANRGIEIGGWKILAFSPGHAELEKTTPHHCGMEEGILAQALVTVGAPAIVNQNQCFRRGADACHFVITSSVTDKRWGA